MKKEKEILSIREQLRKLDFHYYIDYELNSEQAEDHYERCANDYCRCTTISPEVRSFDYKEVVRIIVEHFAIENEKVKYCVERICSTLTKDDFYCDKSGGYYGEELDSICIDNYEVLNKLEEVIDIKVARKKKLDKINEENKVDDQIRKVLVMEYGYLLDDLKTSKFSVIEINPQDIIFPQEEYAKKLSIKKIEGYKNHFGICGIVKAKGSKYKVIDGYHRITANLKKSKIKVILSK